MSTTLSVDVDFPIGTYAFVCSGYNEVTRVKIAKIGVTWQDDNCQVIYEVFGNGRTSYKQEDLFPTADAVFAAKDAEEDDEEEEEA